MSWYCLKKIKKDVEKEKEKVRRAEPELSFEDVDCPAGKKDLSTGQILKVKMLPGNRCNKAKTCKKISCGYNKR